MSAGRVIVAEAEFSSTTGQEVDTWLEAGIGWRQWRFPRGLQRDYEQDTRRSRSRAAGLMSLLGAAVAVMLYPVLQAAAPDMQPESAQLFLGVAVPFTALLSLAVLFNPAPLLRECLLALPVAVDATVLTYLFAKTAANATELYVAAIILMLAYTCVTVQIRFAVAVAVTVYVVGLYALCFTVLRPDVRYHHDYLVAMTAAIAAYMLLGNWRLHADQRRSYALMLREKLRQQALALRNQELDELSRQDPLTGLANRRAYDAWLEEHWLQAAATGAPLGLIMVDIDRFKAFNDVNGHPAGDTCLRAVAVCLREALRGVTGLIARVGGEEFVVLLPGHTEDACAAVAERVRLAAEGLNIRHPALGAGRVITVSAGCASGTVRDHADISALCAAADSALYQAKQAGRNCVRRSRPPSAGWPRREGGFTGWPIAGVPAQSQ